MKFLSNICAIVCLLTFVMPAFAQGLEFKFTNYHLYETFLEDPDLQPTEYELNKEIESIFKFTDDGIGYICRFKENGESSTIMIIESLYKDIVVVNLFEDLVINFIPFDSSIRISPLGGITYLDPKLESILVPYKNLDDLEDIVPSENVESNFFEFLTLIEALHDTELLEEEEYNSLLKLLLSE